MATKIPKQMAASQVVAYALALLLAIALPTVEARSLLAEELSPPVLGPGSVKTIWVAGGTLSDPTLEITQGDTVVWFIADRSAALYFDEDGTRVPVLGVSTQSLPLSDTRAYPTGVLLPGKKASLYFIEPGIYEYVVVFEAKAWHADPQPRVVVGRIIVK